MQTALARPGTGVPPRGQGMNGRLAVVLIGGLVVAFMAVALYLAFSQRWRQSEQLVAPGLRHPRGIAVVRSDLLAVAEAGTPGRLSWVSTGESSRGTLVEGLPSEEGASGPVGPVAVAVAADMRPYALTGGCGAPLCAALLSRADASGSLSVVASLRDLAPDGRSDPWALVLGPDGQIDLTDPGAGTIVRVDPRATPAVVTVVARPGTAADPRGIARGADGALYVALRGAGAVARLTPDGALAPVVGDLDRPIGVGVEPDGHLLVLEQGADERAGRLIRVDPARPQERQSVSANLDRPVTLTVDPEGRAYVALDGGDGAGAIIQIRRLGPQPPRRSI